ncbi:hypothetical protein FRC14_005040 [Serendipita sp. 396]|nr:hypothetical protein FRC14_005040 [Serendipita sp. 396]KAG8787418.1 hypothetical protein FRC15_009232 [Serendipita sp. 397]KAG8873082.1 hypothetical protein FRC20_008709 [Serendipita sp. 405]
MSTAPAICVYCASSKGTSPAYLNSARSVGKALAGESRRLVYGGGKMGLMGAVAEAVLENGGYVTGVSPYAMVASGGESSKTNGVKQSLALDVAEDKVSNREPVPHPNRESIIVDSMHDRKTMMAKLADGGFVSLPGGYGTLEELLEVTTWSQLAIHDKPIILVNVLNYYSPLKEQLRVAVEAGFVRAENLQLLTFVDGPEDLNEHVDYDWGSAVVKVLDEWKPTGWKGFGFDWTKKQNGQMTPMQAI